MNSRLPESIENNRAGPTLALIAAALFGLSTPLAKLLLGHLEPVLLAALLYLGSGVGLSVWLVLRRLIGNEQPREARLKGIDLPWFGSAILSGGIVGPIL